MDSSILFECFYSYLHFPLAQGFDPQRTARMHESGLHFFSLTLPLIPAPPGTKRLFSPSFELRVLSYPEFFLASFPCIVFQALVLCISRKVFGVHKFPFLLNKSWGSKLKMELTNIICQLKMNNYLLVL